jgi:hypothetical protein
MNDIKMVVARCTGRSEEYQPVDIFLDGKRLIDQLRQVEALYAEQEGSPDLAGQYHSLSVRTTFFPSRHFLGEPCPILQHEGKTAILICTCGCEGCWDFVCKIIVSEQTVTWSDFEQIHRNWDYSTLGEFVFDRTQYENELRFPVRVDGPSLT